MIAGGADSVLDSLHAIRAKSAAIIVLLVPTMTPVNPLDSAIDRVLDLLYEWPSAALSAAVKALSQSA